MEFIHEVRSCSGCDRVPCRLCDSRFSINYEGPGVQNSTAGFSVSGVETFTGRPTGVANFTTDFGTAGAIVADYTGGRIDPANQFGSAGGTDNHIVTFSNLTPVEVNFTTVPTDGLNYFGYWLSALNAGNQIQFYNGATLVGTILPGDVAGFTGSCPNSYCGNPNVPFLGNNSNEPYAFLNVYFDGGDTYNRIVFTQTSGGGYESDNHTVGIFTTPGGVVPEPATWAMMILGFGLVGFAARRRARMESTLA